MSRSHRRHSGASDEARSAKTDEPGIRKQMQSSHLDSGPRAKAHDRDDNTGDTALDRHTVGRSMSTLFYVYRACERKLCRRARACLGDGEACFKRAFQLLPDETRAWFLCFFRARADGHGPAAAARIADETMARHARVTAQLEAAPQVIPPLQGEGRPPSEAKAGGVESSEAPPPAHSGARAADDSSIRHPEAAAKPPSKGDGQIPQDLGRASFEARPSGDHLRMTGKQGAQIGKEWAKSRNSGPQDQARSTDLPPSGGQNHVNAPKIRTI